MTDEEFIRNNAADAIHRMLHKFGSNHIDDVFIYVATIYNKHYAPYAKDKREIK